MIIAISFVFVAIFAAIIFMIAIEIMVSSISFFMIGGGFDQLVTQATSNYIPPTNHKADVVDCLTAPIVTTNCEAINQTKPAVLADTPMPSGMDWREIFGDNPQTMVILPTNIPVVEYTAARLMMFGDRKGPFTNYDIITMSINTDDLYRERSRGDFGHYPDRGGLVWRGWYDGNRRMPNVIIDREPKLLWSHGEVVAAVTPGPLGSSLFVLARNVSFGGIWGWKRSVSCVGCNQHNELPIDTSDHVSCERCGAQLPITWKQAVEAGLHEISDAEIQDILNQADRYWDDVDDDTDYDHDEPRGDDTECQRTHLRLVT